MNDRDQSAPDRRRDADEPSQIEAEPTTATAIFRDHIGAARRYAEHLAGPGIVRGLIGPREGARLWTRHLINCAVAAEAIPEGSRVVDIGSGAGLPGIPLLLARPDISVDLVETLLRRTTFLDETVTLLGLSDRCRVVRARAEEAVSVVGGADVVTARAVAPLAKLARWAAPLLRADGLFLALKGGSAADEMERDRDSCARTGIVDLAVRQVGGTSLDEPTTLIVGRRSATQIAGTGRPSSARRRDERRGGGGRGDAAATRGRGQ